MSTPAANSNKEYTVSHVTWRGIGLEVRHCAKWCAMVDMDHIEVVSVDRLPLPITGTGYKSHFISPERIAEIGTPVDYVIAWLDHAAESAEWIKAELESRQLSLF
jgi:hypothetical protein